MMRERLVAAWVATTCLCIVGCSESAMVRSYPPGAKLYVNDHFEGIAPIIYTTPHSQIGQDFQVRLEREGYTTLESTLRKQICPGRIVGGIFTLGIVLIIRGPTCFVSPQDFSLDPIGGGGTSGGPDGTDAGGGRQPSIEDRLRRIERMRDQGTINQQEFEQYRKEILKGL
jgi:hypothetical protein